MREAVQSGDGADRWGGVRIQRKTAMRRSAGKVLSRRRLGSGRASALFSILLRDVSGAAGESGADKPDCSATSSRCKSGNTVLAGALLTTGVRRRTWDWCRVVGMKSKAGRLR